MTPLSYDTRGLCWRVDRGIPFSGGMPSKREQAQEGSVSQGRDRWAWGLAYRDKRVQGLRGVQRGPERRGLYTSGRGQRVLHACALLPEGEGSVAEGVGEVKWVHAKKLAQGLSPGLYARGLERAEGVRAGFDPEGASGAEGLKGSVGV